MTGLHHVAAEALDAIKAAVEEEERVREVAAAKVAAAVQAARETPGVTMEQIGKVLGVSRRAVYKRLDKQ